MWESYFKTGQKAHLSHSSLCESTTLVWMILLLLFVVAVLLCLHCPHCHCHPLLLLSLSWFDCCFVVDDFCCGCCLLLFSSWLPLLSLLMLLHMQLQRLVAWQVDCFLFTWRDSPPKRPPIFLLVAIIGHTGWLFLCFSVVVTMTGCTGWLCFFP